MESSKVETKKSKVLETQQDNSNIIKKKPQQHKFLIWLGAVVIVILLLLSPFIASEIILKEAGVGSYFGAIKGFLFSGNSEIKSEGGRVNVLILGEGGKGHAGADLTDTMIFGSVSLTNHSIRLISIPRDIWIPGIRAKINSAYYWGNTQTERGGGLAFAKQIVSEVTGQPVDYAVVIDFSGFQDVIDTLGGIDVNVDRSFTDTMYPIAGKENDTCGGDLKLACRYETIYFNQGLNHMDGATALKFVRSREGDNGENTDFARDARQQKVVAAISKKVLSVATILNPIKDYKIIKIAKDSVATDINPTVGGILARIILSSKNDMKSYVLSADLLISPSISPKYDSQYVLIPKKGSGDWSEINKWVVSILN